MEEKARELCEKIRSIYPEIGYCGIDVNLEFDKNKNAWVVKLEEKARELCEKIRSIYPEIGHCGIDVNLEFDKNKNAWVVKLDKEGKHLTTHLETRDADECMEGKECVHLGVQIAIALLYDLSI